MAGKQRWWWWQLLVQGQTMAINTHTNRWPLVAMTWRQRPLWHVLIHKQRFTLLSDAGEMGGRQHTVVCTVTWLSMTRIATMARTSSWLFLFVLYLCVCARACVRGGVSGSSTANTPRTIRTFGAGKQIASKAELELVRRVMCFVLSPTHHVFLAYAQQQSLLGKHA